MGHYLVIRVKVPQADPTLVDPWDLGGEIIGSWNDEVRRNGEPHHTIEGVDAEWQEVED